MLRLKELFYERDTIQNLGENDLRNFCELEFETTSSKSSSKKLLNLCHKTYQIPGRFFLKIENNSIEINKSVRTCSHFTTFTKPQRIITQWYSSIFKLRYLNESSVAICLNVLLEIT